MKVYHGYKFIIHEIESSVECPHCTRPMEFEEYEQDF